MQQKVTGEGKEMSKINNYICQDTMITPHAVNFIKNEIADYDNSNQSFITNTEFEGDNLIITIDRENLALLMTQFWHYLTDTKLD